MCNMTDAEYRDGRIEKKNIVMGEKLTVSDAIKCDKSYIEHRNIFNYIQLHNIHFSDGNEMQLGCMRCIDIILFCSFYVSLSLTRE